MLSFELLYKLENAANKNAYQDCIFIIDSLRNFVDISNDNKTMKVMDALMNIRDAGATIVLLHHANKDGKNYQGSNNIKNSIDCMYQLTKHRSSGSKINVSLEVKKERAGIIDNGFSIDVLTLEIDTLDMTIANMSENEEKFIDNIVFALKNKSLNKTQLLNQLGYGKGDKTARDMLDKFNGIFWNSRKKGNVYTYELTTSTTCKKNSNVISITEAIKERRAV